MKNVSKYLIILLAVLILVVPAGATDYQIWAGHDALVSKSVPLGEAYVTIRDETTGSATDNATTEYLSYLQANTTPGTDLYKLMGVSYYTFDLTTYSVPAGETITSASLHFRVGTSSPSRIMGGINNISVIRNSTVVDPYNYANADYGSWDKVSPKELAEQYDWSATTTNSEIVINLNSDGIANISRNGPTVFILMDSDQIDGTFSGTWSSNAFRRLYVNGSAAVPASTAPYLNITTTSLRHPMIFNSTTDPRVVNAGAAYMTDNITRVVSGATEDADYFLGLTYEKTEYSLGRPNSWTMGAMQMAYAYQLTGDTKYVNKTVDILLNMTPNCMTDNMTYYDEDPGDWAMPYDMIHQTKGVNSTLDAANDTQIRNNLAIYADTCYQTYEDDPNPHHIIYRDPVAYIWVASIGEILTDYTNATMETTPAQWQVLGEEGLWGDNDPLHEYTSHRVSTDNLGAAMTLADPFSGANLVGRYTLNFPYVLPRWANAWSNIHNQNYLETYPRAKNYALHDIWQSDPTGYRSSTNTGKPDRVYVLPLYYQLLDATNLSIAKWADERDRASPEIISRGNHGTSEEIYPTGWVFWVKNVSTVTATHPAYTSNLLRNGSYQTLRTDWSANATWLRFIGYLNPMPENERFSAYHKDQLTFEYYALGDRLMADGGDSATSTGYNGISHNGIMIDNGSIPFNNQGFYGGCITYVSPSHGQTLIAGNTIPWVESKNVVKTPNIEYMDFRIRNSSFSNPGIGHTANTTIYLIAPVNVSRAIMQVSGYMVVFDTVETTSDFGIYNNFRFTSYDLLGNTSIGPLDDRFTGAARANGVLDIGGEVYDWAATSASWETDTGKTTGNITWQTTNRFGRNVVLNLFTAPSSKATEINFVSTMTGTSWTLYDAGTGLSMNPQVIFKRDPAKSLYRVTALIPRYAEDTAKVPSEITVTGTGSAIKVDNDRIYNGVGTSTFDGFTTDADTVFIRKGTAVSDYFVTNATTLSDAGSTLMTSTTRLNSLTYNKSGTVRSVNVSGTGSTTLGIATTSAPSYVTIDGVAAESTYSSGILSITTTLSDHDIQFDESGSPAAGPSSKNWWWQWVSHTFGLGTRITGD